jgi:hypothetical protein
MDERLKGRHMTYRKELLAAARDRALNEGVYWTRDLLARAGVGLLSEMSNAQLEQITGTQRPRRVWSGMALAMAFAARC